MANGGTQLLTLVILVMSLRRMRTKKELEGMEIG
jgi:hypothetical protein